MKLGVNGWRLSKQRTGVGRYLLNVLRHWDGASLDGQFERVRLYTPAPLDREGLGIPESVEIVELTSNLPMLLWENVRLAPAAGDDVILHPSYSIPLYRRGSTVAVAHDAAHERFPELFPASVRYFYRYLYRWSARRADLVISDSEAGSRDVSETMGVPLEKVRTIHLAPDDFFRTAPPDEAIDHVRRTHLGSDVPYFMFVGKLSGRRSIPLLLEGFAAFKRATGLPHKLLVIGLNIHQIDVRRMIEDQSLEEQVIYPGFISDEDLACFYHGATGLISPSIYETVSLPVLEAMAVGTPVICPDTAGMREITGGHALLLDNPVVSEMEEAVCLLAEDEPLRRRLSEDGRAYNAQFTWARCAAETLDVLAEAVHL